MGGAKEKIDEKKLRSWKLLDDFRRRLAKSRAEMPPPHPGGFSPPVPKGSGGRFPNQTINYNPMNHTAPGNSC